ncbi:D-2-hydroxyacid dehydrogenase [bacterium]|nr:D-2-hydroxyacid dehydrogenase [bacterium]MBU1884532.1 D-2-hydroxyacid dehydrogenase [bacterium]
MNIVLLDTLTFGDTDLGGFDALGNVSVYQKTLPEELDERIANADVIVTNKVVITSDSMDKAKKLKLICIAATGMNNVDLVAAKERGIEVKNVVGYSTESVVQHTFAMLFYLVEHLKYYDGAVKDGFWSRSGIFTDISNPFFEISGKKWGIIGLGTIGKKVAVLAKAFGCDVSYFSTSGKNLDSDFNSVTLDELLKESDIITIHAPLNDATNNLLDYERLLTCKDGAIVLNLGRGGIIDEYAVAKIIDEKDISFGLDVLMKEPIEKDHPLLGVRNRNKLFITPHIAWTSKEARDTLIATTIENIRSL